MLLGINQRKTSQQIFWEKEKVINGHMMLVGASGMGKSWTLKKILKDLGKEINDIQVHIIDVHGDLDIENSEEIKFSEISNNGINPLKISSDPEFGGVRKRIRNFISTINRTSRKLGSKQESVMISLLNDLYIENGFYPDDYTTWSLQKDPRKSSRFPKRYPTIQDLKRFTERKLQELYHGADSKAIIQLGLLMKEVKKRDRAQNNVRKAQFDENIKDKELEKLDKIKEKTKEMYMAYVDTIKTGKEFEEVLKYDSPEVLKSVYERISTLESSGIFKNLPLNNNERNKLYRYNIKPLNTDEQRLFVDILLEDIYAQSKEDGEQPYPKTFIVIDEASIFTSDDSEHIINVISKEARKFGVGLILASQSFSHFSNDLISNSNTKIILGIDEMEYKDNANKLQIEVKRFSYIIPHKSILVQVKQKGSMSNQYYDCLLPK